MDSTIELMTHQLFLISYYTAVIHYIMLYNVKYNNTDKCQIQHVRIVNDLQYFSQYLSFTGIDEISPQDIKY